MATHGIIKRKLTEFIEYELNKEITDKIETRIDSLVNILINSKDLDDADVLLDENEDFYESAGVYTEEEPLFDEYDDEGEEAFIDEEN